MSAVSPLPVNDHRFARLASRLPNTAAGRGLPLLIWSDAVSKDLEMTANYHDDFYSLYIVRQGRGTHVIEGEVFGVARGDVYVMVPGMTHHFRGCHSLVTDTFHFHPAIFDCSMRDVLNETPGFRSLFIEQPLARGGDAATPCGRWLHLSPPAQAQARAAVTELRAEWERGDATGMILARGLFFRLLVHLARCHVASTPPDFNPAPFAGEETVAAALAFMEERFTEPLRVEEIARAVFLSPDRFTEVFAQGVGRTPSDYLRYLRVEKAKELLMGGDDSMTRVALSSGFGDPAYFARAFRAAVGTSPSGWRKAYRAQAAI